MTAVLNVFTDGACHGNPGPGGWGWIIDPDTLPHDWTGSTEGSGGTEQTTNQRMELTAALMALRIMDMRHVPHVRILSDSTYLVKCFTDGWWRGWLRRNWTNAKGDPVANADLWKLLIPLATERPMEVTFQWVKAHCGIELNEAADRLATAGVPGVRTR